MRILVADDEYLVRSTIKSMLLDLGINERDIDEAANGSEVINAIGVKSYHIIFIDIRMPIMDGLEAIRIGKEMVESARWVVISGHSEFQYAQQAIKLGVKDYLLKPVEPVELEQLIEDIREEFKNLAMMANQEAESEINSLYSGLLDDNKLIEEYKTYQSIHLHLDVFNKESKQKIIKSLYNELNESFRTYINQDRQIVPISGSGVDLTYVVCSRDDVDITDQMLNTMRRLAHKYTDDATKLFVLYSDKLFDEDRLLGQIRQIENLLELRFLLWDTPIIDIATLSEVLTSSNIERLETVKDIHQLYRLFNEGEMAAVISIVDKLLSRNLDEDTRLLLLKVMDIQLSLDKLKKMAEKALSSEIKESTDIIEVTKDYVLKNYMHNIGVNQIAEMLHITPNYLSALFKKKEDITFVRYLTGIRMDKAHELLSHGNMKVNDVANSVGFYSARHFSKLYKQRFGHHPSESQKK